MNRYVLDGILGDARSGRRVITLSASQTEARELFNAVAARLRDGERAFRTNGMERIETPAGGWVRFLSVRAGVRGLCADVVVLDAEPTPRKLEDILPIVAASRGEVIRA